MYEAGKYKSVTAGFCYAEMPPELTQWLFSLGTKTESVVCVLLAFILGYNDKSLK